MAKSIVLLGGPDSGKTNYVGRLWTALDAKAGNLVASFVPPDIDFVLDTAEHLSQGHFAPRTERTDKRRDFEITVRTKTGEHETEIVVPDISGELWTTAVLDSEISKEWMTELESGIGAILFVRVGSDQNKPALDWVTSAAHLKKLKPDEKAAPIPTQVLLVELVRFLEFAMAAYRTEIPRLSVVVAAWDKVSKDLFEAGPLAYLQKEYPMFAGRLEDTELLDVQVFGLSVVGGDLSEDPEFRDKFLDEGVDGQGWIARYDENTKTWLRDVDLTTPVGWAMGL